uniref:Spliceosome-associated protein CWC27 homolog n=1 Tax=Panagrellus redivivus TaxID=6233 RepID=A0A7E4VJI8_PANRE
MSSMYINEPRTSGKVCIVTTLGDIDVELWSKECPLAVRNFIQLALEGHYDGTTFHRLQKDFLVQGGDPTGTGEADDSIYGGLFKTEAHQRLQFTRRGLLGTAGGKDACGGQFFFTLGPAPELYKKHTLFGKVTGNTVFNLMRFNDSAVDANHRPVPEQRVLKVKILDNPFPDIVPRVRKEEPKTEKKKDKKKSTAPKATSKNTALLSFGDEVEEEEAVLAKVNKDISKKGKSAHDVLNDEKLSKAAAVAPEELSTYEKPASPNDSDDEAKRAERLEKVKAKLQKRKLAEKAKDDEDDDIIGAIADEKKRKIAEEKARVAEELREMQRGYAKSIRAQKAEDTPNAEEPQTEAMKEYRKMRLTFKKDTKGIVKQSDPKREAQTMAMLDQLRTRISRSSVTGVISDQKVDMSDVPTLKDTIEGAAKDGLPEDEDKEELVDETDDAWMSHKFIAPEDTSGVTKARDANMKDQDEEWYPIGDPRNKIAQRRRDGATDAS